MQQAILSVDVGSGMVKGLSGDGRRIQFQSVLAPTREDGFDGVFPGEDPGYRVAIKFPGGERRNWLVGERALQSPLATMSLSYRKPQEIHDVLLLTAARLLVNCNGFGEVTLAAGVPLAIYLKDKVTLKRRLLGLSAVVGVGDEEDRPIAFTRAEVYPQGAGVVLASMAAGSLPDGLTGVVDIGEYTTDILLIDVRGGRPILLSEEHRTSLTSGVYLVTRSIMSEFRRQTGAPLELAESAAVTWKALTGQVIVYNGKGYDLGDAAGSAVRDAGILISRGIANTWGTRVGFLENVLLAGGGALIFEEVLARTLPNVKVVEDPVYANATGYLMAVSSSGN
ncbi:MAG: ParM/StbA family protein [Firmicutes bacterium]|nr:ParM/StbA family protein [Bacillota bacterium]